MENKEFDVNQTVYDYVNTVNNNYARINEDFRIPNIMMTWNYKLNELKNNYRRVNLDINETITGSIILKHVEKIITNALMTLIDFGEKTNVNFPESDLKTFLQKKKYIKHKNMLEKYIGYDEAIKELKIEDVKDYIMLACLYLQDESYSEEDVLQYIYLINEELQEFDIYDTDEMNAFIYNSFRGNDDGNTLSRK